MKKKMMGLLLAGVMVFGMSAVSRAETGWYELNGTMITVHVPLNGNAAWEVNPVGAEGLDLITSETNNGEWVATYAYNGEYIGDDRLEVICSVDGLSYGYYTVDMWYSENGDIEVTNAYGDVEAYEESEPSPESDSSSEGDAGTDFGQPGFASYTAYITATDGLLLRNGPGSEYESVGSLEHGQKVTVVGETNGWAMTFDETGRTGYCSTKYLSTKAEDVSGNKNDTNKAEAADEKETGILTLNLWGNQGEKKNWKFSIENEDVAELVNSCYIEEEDNKEDEAVTDGYWNGSFRGLKEGETLLTLNYGTEENVEKTLLVHLWVDQDGKVDVTEINVR
ncbi:MAG: SH3 domain-containing protein [Eubacteriales bacterium]|nr:SH3 domain-containing protein [Eubacteriales bacterium]